MQRIEIQKIRRWERVGGRRSEVGDQRSEVDGIEHGAWGKGRGTMDEGRGERKKLRRSEGEKMGKGWRAEA